MHKLFFGQRHIITFDLFPLYRMRAFAKFFKSDAFDKAWSPEDYFFSQSDESYPGWAPENLFQRCHRDFPAQSHARLARVDGDTEFRLARCRRAKQAKAPACWFTSAMNIEFGAYPGIHQASHYLLMHNLSAQIRQHRLASFFIRVMSSAVIDRR